MTNAPYETSTKQTFACAVLNVYCCVLSRCSFNLSLFRHYRTRYTTGIQDDVRSVLAGPRHFHHYTPAAWQRATDTPPEW